MNDAIRIIYADLVERREAAAGQLEVSVGAIAELAGRKPYVASQWRKVTKNPFPHPVTRSRSPLFNAGEVLSWMAANNKARVSEHRWFWRQAVRNLDLHGWQEQFRPFLAALVTTAAAVIGHLPGFIGQDVSLPGDLSVGSWDSVTTAPTWRELAQRVERDVPALQGRLVNELEAVQPEPAQFEVLVLSLLAALTGPADRLDPAWLLDDVLGILTDRDANLSHPALAELVVALAGVDRGASVLDPACGEGEFLVHLAEHVPEASIHGQDNDADAVAVAWLRLFLHGFRADISEANSFEADAPAGAHFDLVVIDPPFGDRLNRRWLDLAAAHLHPDGRALVIVPMRAVGAEGAASGSFRRGEIEAVILLPNSLRQEAREPLALCVLTGQAKRNDAVLVADLSDQSVGNLRSATLGTHRPASTERKLPVEALARALRQWHTGRTMTEDPTGLGLRTVAVTDAIRYGITRTQRPVPTDGPPDDILTLARKLESALETYPATAKSDPLRAALTVFLGSHVEPVTPPVVDSRSSRSGLSDMRPKRPGRLQRGQNV